MVSNNASNNAIRERNKVAIYIPFIKTFVYDKGGRCLKSEIIREIFELELEEGRNNCFPIPCKKMVRAMVDSFESKCLYDKEIVFEKSKMSNRIIYKYVEPVVVIDDDLIDDDITPRFEPVINPIPYL